MACTLCQLALGAAPLAMWALRKPPRMDPTGKHVLITGGSEGLGLSFAEVWVKHNANVTIVARTQAKLDDAKSHLQALIKECGSTARVECFSADTTDLPQLKQAVEAAESAIGPVDVLICNAGLSKPGYFIEQPMEEFRRTMDVNYFGTVQTVKVIAPNMIARRQGHIALVGSAMSITGFAGYSSYAPSKWALRGFADCLRNEFVGTGVGVSIVYPPDTDTPGYKAENQTKPPECVKISEGEALMQPEKVAKHTVEAIRRGDYHVPPPDFGQELLAAKMAGLTPAPGSLIVNLILAPLLVLLAMFYRWNWDNIVAKCAKDRKPWKAAI